MIKRPLTLLCLLPAIAWAQNHKLDQYYRLVDPKTGVKLQEIRLCPRQDSFYYKMGAATFSGTYERSKDSIIMTASNSSYPFVLKVSKSGLEPFTNPNNIIYKSYEPDPLGDFNNTVPTIYGNKKPN